MSVSAEHIRITAYDYEALLRDPEYVDQFFGYVAPDGSEYPEKLRKERRTCVTGARWQALHYLLTGEVASPGTSTVAPPLCNVVLGGVPVLSEMYAEDVRYLTPHEVREVASVLSALDPGTVLALFKARAHTHVTIYRSPPPVQWNEEYLEPLLDLYSGLRAFYSRAADENEAVLIWIG